MIIFHVQLIKSSTCFTQAKLNMELDWQTSSNR